MIFFVILGHFDAMPGLEVQVGLGLELRLKQSMVHPSFFRNFT